MTAPAFSVVIAVYNGAATLRRAIESVLAQSYAAHEVIVVDDGSTDGTAAVAHEFGGAVRYLHQTNTGVSAARNAGARVATGDWLAFLDADDWYYPDRLERHARWIIRDTALDFLTGDFDYVRPDGTFIRRSMESTEAGRYLLAKAAGADSVVMEGTEIGRFVERHFGDTHTLSLPRARFLELGGYPPGVAVCEDVNLLVRLCAKSRRVGVVCRPMAAYCIHDQSATRADPLRAQRQTLQALLPLRLQLADAPSAIRAGLEGCLRHARLDLAYTLLRGGQRLHALRAVAPLLVDRRNIQSVRDILSIVRGAFAGNKT